MEQKVVRALTMLINSNAVLNAESRNILSRKCSKFLYQFHTLGKCSPPSGFEQKKNTRKKCPFLRKKNTISAKKKKHFLALYLFLKGYFVYLFYPFNMFKTINYLLLFINISKTSYFTKQQTPLMIIISHNFKEMIFFIRID